MNAIGYIVEVIICSGLFLVFYRWTIARKVGFRLCRIYLMVTLLLSAVIPAMNVPMYTVREESLMTVFFADEWDMLAEEEAPAALQQAGITKIN